MKERLDVLVVDQGLAESREQAQRLIRAGLVLIDGHPVSKPGHRFDVGSRLQLKELPRYVSRGGNKLEGAIVHFNLSVAGVSCLDVGSSTGGFTDCLLQHGAAAVACVDVGRSQLHWKIRQDPRVTVIEGFNARYLAASDLPFVPGFACVDVSFISLTLVLPPVIDVLTGGGTMVTLIKPQFEAGREQVGRGGVVRDEGVRAEVVERIRAFGVGELGLTWVGVCESPLRGPAGNTEYLACWRKAAGGASGRDGTHA